jgi:hypothetical protein
MSWGERSCEKPCARPDGPTMECCNVNCAYYKWDGTTKPDSEVVGGMTLFRLADNAVAVVNKTPEEQNMSRMTTAALAAVSLVCVSGVAKHGPVELAPRGRGFQSNRHGVKHGSAGRHQKKARNRKGKSR